MADQTIPRYGSVESYARILRPLKREHLEDSALAIVQMLVDHPDDSDARKVELVKNLLAAVELVRHDPLGNTSGLDYSRADDADDPTSVSGARVEPHVGAVTEAGLVDETACPSFWHNLEPGDRPSVCPVCGESN